MRTILEAQEILEGDVLLIDNRSRLALRPDSARRSTLFKQVSGERQKSAEHLGGKATSRHILQTPSDSVQAMSTFASVDTTQYQMHSHQLTALSGSSHPVEEPSPPFIEQDSIKSAGDIDESSIMKRDTEPIENSIVK